MSIHTIIQICCDDCGRCFPVRTPGSLPYGWQVGQFNGAHTHTCPTCLERQVQERAREQRDDALQAAIRKVRP